MIPYSRQQVSEEDIAAVVDVLRSDFLTQGPVVPEFEQAVADRCQAVGAVAANNATAALHLACLSLGINQQSLVWVAATSFVASANCARFCGAEVDFIDIDPDSGLVSLPALEEKLRTAPRLPNLLIVVHLAGQSCDMQAIAGLCQPHSIRVLEDACHALGANYHNRPVGSCQYSDAAVFSFHPVKPITCGEGGMLLSRDQTLLDKARVLANHGIVRSPDDFLQEPTGGWHYEQQQLGYNYRLSDMQAALGLSQLSRLDMFTEQRRALARYYQQGFAGSDIAPVKVAEHDDSAWHLYPVLFPTAQQRRKAYDFLRNAGFGVNVHYQSIPAQPYYQQLGFDPNDFSGAGFYAEHSLSLPLFPGLDTADVDRVIALCQSALD